jgi:hypothetical protein
MKTKTKGGLCAALLIGMILCTQYATCNAEKDNLIPKITRVDTTQTLASFDHVGKFHTLDFVGDYQYLLDIVNNWFSDGKSQGTNHFFCSLFSALGDQNELLMGRNFDNPYCDILTARYSPPDGYSNIALNRLADIGLPSSTNFNNLTYSQSLRLLYAPYFAADGINECGLAIGVAYISPVQIQVDPTKESVWVTRVIREVLDYASTVDEALAIANSFNVFDTGANNDILSHHYIVTDSSGASYILEYVTDQFVAIEPTVDWQVLTNSHIYNVPLYQLMNGCWRYNILYTSLQNYGGCVDYLGGFGLLSDVSWGTPSNGTEWSAMYDINGKGAFISTYRDFESLVYVDVENFEFVNYGNVNMEYLSYSDADNNYIIEPGETAEIVVMIEPEYMSTGTVLLLETDDPAVQCINDEIFLGTIAAGDFASNFDDPFIIVPTDDITPHSVLFTITVVTDYGYECGFEFELFVGAGNVLVINGDSEQQYSSYFQEALIQTNRRGHLWDRNTWGEVPGPLYDEYNSVIWFTGDTSENTITTSERNDLKNFMDGGGNVFMTGQDVCDDIKDTELFTDYFHAEHDLYAWPFYDIAGCDGDPVGGDLFFSISGGDGADNQVTQSSIDADDQAALVCIYDGCTANGGVRYEGDYKSILLSFGFEAISTLEDRTDLMDRIMSYFDVPVSTEPTYDQEDRIILMPNTPNPFSTSTKISFSLPHPEKVKIQIYNLKGQLVETLLDEYQTAGQHSVELYADEMSSGIYFMKLLTKEREIVRKIVIIK